MWFPGYERKYNEFLDKHIVQELAVPYTVFAQEEMTQKPGPIGVVEVPYYDIDSPLTAAIPALPPVPPTGMPERKTKIQIGGG